MKNFVKAIVCTLVIGLTIFYLFLPPINITSLEFYSFLIFLILVYLCFRYVIFDIRNNGNGIRGLVKYGVFIMTATQLNADYITAQQYDQNLLRGAKSIADKIDCGMIMLQTSQEDLEALQKVITEGGFEQPMIKISVYKNRRGRYKDILLWCRARRGVCKIEPMFATNYQYELVPIDELKIKVKKFEASAF